MKFFDVRPYLQYPIYESLKNPDFFRTAHVMYGTVIWSNEIDLDPDMLYLEGKTVITK